jgi:hypothetical protein
MRREANQPDGPTEPVLVLEEIPHDFLVNCGDGNLPCIPISYLVGIPDIVLSLILVGMEYFSRIPLT